VGLPRGEVRTCLDSEVVEPRIDERGRGVDLYHQPWLITELYNSLFESYPPSVKVNNRCEEIAKHYAISYPYVRVREMIETYKAFSNKEDRKYSLSFCHYHLAAQTHDPRGWMKKAEENNWSFREFRNALYSAKIVPSRRAGRVSERTAKAANSS